MRGATTASVPLSVNWDETSDELVEPHAQSNNEDTIAVI